MKRFVYNPQIEINTRPLSNDEIQQFNNMVCSLTPAELQNLVTQARSQGISEQDILNGLNYIKNI